jgi:RNA polymerase-binding transcription factor DksA
MTPASKGAQVKRVSAPRSTAAARSSRAGGKTATKAGNKKTAGKVGATATKRPALTKKKAVPVVKKAATATKKATPATKKPPTNAKKAAPAKRPAPAAKKAAVAPKKPAPAAKKPAPAKKTAAPAKKAAEKPAAKTVSKTATRSSAGAGNGAVARSTFAPKPKPVPVRPKTGPYAKDTKFLEEVRDLLTTERAVYQEQATSLRAEADSLALEREPGDVQFDEESGEGGTVTVDRERNLALSGQASLAVEEIDDAAKRIADKTYGYCERCFQPIPKPRLRALPYARLCVACKSGGLSRR